MALLFEWDPQKAGSNEAKHGVSFEEARSVFGDSLALIVRDEVHSLEEPRLFMVGLTPTGRCLAIAYTIRGTRLRIISARAATRTERKRYEEGTDNRS